MEDLLTGYNFYSSGRDMEMITKIVDVLKEILEYDKQQEQPLFLRTTDNFIMNIARKVVEEKKKSFLIAITGESASGKTVFVDNTTKACVKTQKDGYYTKLKVLSTGNSRIRYDGKIQIIEGKKLIDEYALTGSVVGDNNSLTTMQKMKTDKITKAGEYTIRLILSYLDEKDNKKIIKKDTILKTTGDV